MGRRGIEEGAPVRGVDRRATLLCSKRRRIEEKEASGEQKGEREVLPRESAPDGTKRCHARDRWNEIEPG